MTRLRIVCRVPPRPPPTPGFPRFDPIASIADTRVYAVGDDGTEVELTNIDRVEWSVGGAEAARAVVTFVNAEVNVEAECECDTFHCFVCGTSAPHSVHRGHASRGTFAPTDLPHGWLVVDMYPDDSERSWGFACSQKCVDDWRAR